MIPVDLTLAFFLLLVILNYRAHRSVLYPPFIFSAMWLLDLLVVRSGLVELDPLHGNTLAIVAAGAASFSVGGLLAGLVPREMFHIHLFPPEPERTSEFLRKSLMIVLLLGMPVLFYQTWKLSASQGGGLNILAQARLEMVEAAQGGEPIRSFVLERFTSIAITVSLLFSTGKKDRTFWVVTAIALFACILTTGRTSLLLLISGLGAILLIQRKEESLLGAMRLLRWPIALFFALYIGLIFTNKNTEGVTGGAIGVATILVLSYIACPLAAFDRVVQSPADFVSTASHTFQFPLHLAAVLHLVENYTKPPLLDSFVLVPFPTNVYTVFKFYFLEVGTFGTIVILFSIGLLHSLLYLKARQGGRFSMFLFAISIYSVLIVIFDDAYFDTAIYLRAIGFGLLFFLIGSVPLRLFPANKQGHLASQTGQ
ncbi:MAG: O-antigen polymerase [Terracidiphilus sp.]|jgi:oligosaccharide repeat unit polymerase